MTVEMFLKEVRADLEARLRAIPPEVRIRNPGAEADLDLILTHLAVLEKQAALPAWQRQLSMVRASWKEFRDRCLKLGLLNRYRGDSDLKRAWADVLMIGRDTSKRDAMKKRKYARSFREEVADVLLPGGLPEWQRKKQSDRR